MRRGAPRRGQLDRHLDVPTARARCTRSTCSRRPACATRRCTCSSTAATGARRTRRTSRTSPRRRGRGHLRRDRQLRPVPGGHPGRHGGIGAARDRLDLGAMRAYGGDPHRLTLSGHSAGAHLCAMALTHDWTAVGLPGDVIKGAVPISGIFDPEPAMHTTVNAEIGLTEEIARRNNACGWRQARARSSCSWAATSPRSGSARASCTPSTSGSTASHLSSRSCRRAPLRHPGPIRRYSEPDRRAVVELAHAPSMQAVEALTRALAPESPAARPPASCASRPRPGRRPRPRSRAGRPRNRVRPTGHRQWRARDRAPR